jgi:hypothetical protein
LTRRIFTVAAWLAMTSAFATVPLTYLAFALEGRGDTVGVILQGGIQVVGTLLFVAIIFMLKRFLNTLFAFHDTDKSIGLMVMANVVAGAFLLGGICFPGIRESADQAALVLMVFQGIVQLQFGYKLLKLPNNLGGMLKPFCTLHMATGLCIASIVLVLPGVLLSAVTDLMLATIFFKIAKELKEVERNRPETG